jgi:alanine racemase
MVIMEKKSIELIELLEVELKDSESFLKIKETLTRIGVSSKKEKKLYQSCHILHKRGKYYIVHFKELFLLDGLSSNMDETDLGRRNTIAKLLEEWNLLTVVDKDKVNSILTPINQIKIIPHKEKNEWELCPKYHIGKGKK